MSRNINHFITVVIVTLILAFSNVFLAFATELKDGLTIAIPDGYSETEIDGKGVLYHGVNVQGIELGIYEQRNLQTNKIHSWSDKTDEELATMAAHAIEEQDSENTTIEAWSLCTNEQMKYIAFEGSMTADSGDGMEFIQYCTFINGGTLQLTFYKAGEFTAGEKDLAQATAISAHYAHITEPGVDTAFILTLAGVGLVIILLILSVVWNIRRYRRKVKKEVEELYVKEN